MATVKREFQSPFHRVDIKSEPLTPNDPYRYYNENDDEPENGSYSDMDSNNSLINKYLTRKSLSMDDITKLNSQFDRVDLHGDRRSTLARHRSSTYIAAQDPTGTEYVSMAEAIYHFQRDTPGRFHSTSKHFQPQEFMSRMGPTIPQSPKLRCQTRSRRIYALSQKDKEELELQEIKKHKIKANPIPKAVIEGTKKLPEITRKPTTVPSPFKLTEVPKKKVMSPEVIEKFKARPVPKQILERPHIPPKPPVQVTLPVSPKFHFKPHKTNNIRAKSVDKSTEKLFHKSGPMHAAPFSFQKRDEEFKRQKEQKIKQQIEEERKLASQFKAKPVPGIVKKRMLNVNVKSSCSNSSSDNKENHLVKFEARPPLVLYKEPFKPIHQQIHIIDPAPFNLATEKRAAERERYDKLLKQREMEQEKLRQQQEEERQKLEMQMNAELRAKLVHHPKPIQLGSPFVPQKSSAPLTVPETPKFVRNLKKH